MDKMTLYWTIVAGVASLAWTLITYRRNQVSMSVESANALTARLMDCDKLVIENPEIQMYFSKHANKRCSHFRNSAVLKSAQFFKAKAFAYMQLNMFDEILSRSSKASKKLPLFKPPTILELSDWEMYIKVKLRHPLFQSILKNEDYLFGTALWHFWRRHESEITSLPSDPFVW